MTAKIAPANAAAPMAANPFLLSFFLAALQISAAQATQTAAAASAIPSVSHSQDNSYRIFICLSSPPFHQTEAYILSFGFMHCPCFLGFLPYRMASFGQRCRHQGHITHLSLTQTGRLSLISCSAACTSRVAAYLHFPVAEKYKPICFSPVAFILSYFVFILS